MPSKKRATPVSLQPLDALFGTNEESINGISEIAIGSLHPFPNHPFQVRDDKKMEELSESIIQYGVLVPGIVRLRESGGYELVAGHRRKRACELAGLEKMPVIIKDLTDDESTVIMVDSNIQREELLISEKAFAYKMKYEALKRQGKRSDLTSCQVGKKLKSENITLELHSVEATNDTNGLWKIQNNDGERIQSSKELAMQMGESQRQIARYICLTNLIPKILDMVDEGKIAFTIAVELSYLNEEEQYELYAVIDLEQCTPSLSQANRLKRMSQAGNLDMDAMYDVLGEEKPNQKVQIKIQAERLDQYFPSNYTDRQKVELIEKLVKSWHDQRIQKR